MQLVVLISDGLSAFLAGLGPAFAIPEVIVKYLNGNVEIAILAKLLPLLTSFLMLFDLPHRKFLQTVLAFLHSVVFSLVLLLQMAVIHLTALCAPDEVESAVAEMGGNFGLRKLSAAVLAALHQLFQSAHSLIAYVSPSPDLYAHSL